MPPRVARRGWDVLIAGEPYNFGPHGVGGGISLGSAEDVGVQNASLGTIIMPSFHHGYGQEVVGNPQQAFTVHNLDTSIPAHIFLSGFNTSYGPITAAFPVAKQKYFGSLHYDDESDHILLVSERKLARINAGTGVITEATLRGGDTALSGTQAFRGGLFKWFQHWIAGIADDVTYGVTLHDRSVGFAFWDVATDIYDTEIGHDEDHSFGDSNRGRAVYAFNSGLNGQANEIDFTLSIDKRFGDAAGGFTKHGPFQELGIPRLGWVKMVGSTLLIMRENGSILSVDESTGGLALVAENLYAQVGADTSFGWHPKSYLGGLVFPGFGQIWSLDLNSLSITNITPNKVQNAVAFPVPDWPEEGEHAVAVRGDEIWIVSTAATDKSKLVIVRGKHYKDGFHYQTWASTDPVSGIDALEDKLIMDAIIVKNSKAASNDGLWILWRPTTGANTDDAWLTKFDLPATDWSAKPELGAVVLAGVAKLTGSRYGGDGNAAGALKRFIQFRGFFHRGAANQHNVGAIIDDGAPISLTTDAADGVVALDFPATSASVGRDIQVTYQRDQNDLSAVGYAVMPWAFDFLWIPEESDSFTIRIFASNDYQEIRKSARDIFDELDALRHTIVTLKFPHDITWSVFITSVSTSTITALPGQVSGEESMLVTVSGRRL